MFFGHNEKPEFIDMLISKHDLKPQRTKMNVCSKDKGRCGGSVPFHENDTTVWKYRYFTSVITEDMPQEERLALWNDKNNWVYDDGIEVYKYTLSFKGHEYSWIEPIT